MKPNGACASEARRARGDKVTTKQGNKAGAARWRSAGELRCQITLAHDLKLIDDKAHTWLFERTERCSRMLAAYLRHLKSTSTKFKGMKFESEVAE
jgi:four helix bundle protein